MGGAGVKFVFEQISLKNQEESRIKESKTEESRIKESKTEESRIKESKIIFPEKTRIICYNLKKHIKKMY